MAAGLPSVWSTIKFEIVRMLLSTTTEFGSLEGL
jgi:hypothetical protein